MGNGWTRIRSCQDPFPASTYRRQKEGESITRTVNNSNLPSNMPRTKAILHWRAESQNCLRSDDRAETRADIADRGCRPGRR